MRPVCLPCAQEMHCHENEQGVLQSETFRWGDTYKCPGCGHIIITGFGRPIHSYEERFAGSLKLAGDGLVTLK